MLHYTAAELGGRVELLSGPQDRPIEIKKASAAAHKLLTKRSTRLKPSKFTCARWGFAPMP